MTTGATELAERLARVRSRIAAAESAAGRPAGTVRLLLATKTQDAATVRAAVLADLAGTATTAGVARRVLLGENRVQELVAKGPELADLAPELHLIGPLQSNKVNAALRWATCVQSVDSPALADRLARRCAEDDRTLDVLVQVNVSGEPTKHGAAPQDALDVVRAVAGLAPGRVVYVACDPAALARDVAYLAEEGYALADVTGYDLFPMTHHVEAVAVLTR